VQQRDDLYAKMQRSLENFEEEKVQFQRYVDSPQELQPAEEQKFIALDEDRKEEIGDITEQNLNTPLHHDCERDSKAGKNLQK